MTAALLAWLGSRAETRAAMRGIESRLRAMAAATTEIVPDEYHARARAGRVTDAEFTERLERLTRLAKEADVVYLYTCIAQGDDVLFTNSSMTDEERTTGDWSKLLERYEAPPPEIRDTLRDGESRFASYTDEFGSFRSIFVRRGEGADQHVIGVDVALDDIRAMARANLLWYAAVGGIVGLGVSALGVAAGRRIASPIVRLARSIEAFADEDFSNDADAEAELARIAATDRAETGDLAGAFLGMRQRLALHIEELTRITAEKERITSQLEIARKIQRGLLPTSPPLVEGYEIAGWSEAADETGGDYYDWSVTPDGRVIVTIADVTGHGIGSAIMASVCRAYARATLTDREPLTPLLQRLNRLVHDDTRGSQFVTFFAGMLEPSEQRMLVISAGHGPLLLYKAAANEVVSLATHGIPLGIMGEFEFDPFTEVELAPGDTLLLVSDGFFEWMNPAREQFGPARLAQALLDGAGLPPVELIDFVRERVAVFTAGTRQPDDMTAVVIKRAE